MGLLNRIGLGKRTRGPAPAALIAGNPAACRPLILELAGRIDSSLTVSAVIYDNHHGLHALDALPSNVHVNGCLGKDGALACPCHGDGVKELKLAVRRAAKRESPDLMLLHLGPGMPMQEARKDLDAVADLTRPATMAAVLRGASALNEMRDAAAPTATHVRAAGLILLTGCDDLRPDMQQAIRDRLAQLNPKAPVIEDPTEVAEQMWQQLQRARPTE